MIPMILSRDHRPRELNDAITPNWVIGVLRYTRRAEFYPSRAYFFATRVKSRKIKSCTCAIFATSPAMMISRPRGKQMG